MPNATVRANAQTLPETTNRRAVLGAVLAAGVAGATAALPGAAAQLPPLSAIDRRVLDLWRRYTRLRAAIGRIKDQTDAAKAQIPEWARPGPKYVLAKGEIFVPGVDYTGGTSPLPEVADLDQQPVDHLGRILARPSVEELLNRFTLDAWASNHHDARRSLTRSLVRLDERLKEQDAEQERSGYVRLVARYEAGWGKANAIEGAIEERATASILALGAVLVIRIEGNDGKEHVLQAYRASLAAIRQRLIGPIAEAADRVLAEEGEARA
jgi:hypothetical protein